MKKLLIFLILSILYLILYTPKVLGQDFRNDYQVEYFLTENQNQINTQVKFIVSITNFRSDLYVKQFSIGFPKLFTIKNLKAFDDYSELTPNVTTSDSITKIELEFSNPKIGKNSVNNLYLEFSQDNLFNVNGNIWEVIIPTVSEKNNSNYKILVHLPKNSDKKLSIAKPKPDNISQETIIWNNPKTKTVYAVFGQNQYYKTQLVYQIKNNKLIPVFTDIAFPPDTLYQKIYLESIVPTPQKILIDEDGNYLGRYLLSAKETKTIQFKATIVVYTKAREELIESIRLNFSKQKDYLLSESKYWSISENQAIKEIQSNIKDIYYFVTNKLQYNYDKVNSDNVRLGADAVLKNPSNAVCMEFTDLFIAIARNKGIYSREIEGFGFSQDPNLRPLSLVFDILHSWPEYYDSESQLWLPVDPTWENTSGIDYLTSFDLNHIVFVIHGKSDDYPPSAGTYKIEDSRDVSITATDILPTTRKNLFVEPVKFPSQINDNQVYQAKLNITNLGNTYIWNKPIPIKSQNLEISPQKVNFAPLAPYEKKTLLFSYRAKIKNKKLQANLDIDIPKNRLFVQLSVIPFYYDLALKISLFLFTGLLLIFIYLSVNKIFRRKRIK